MRVFPHFRPQTQGKLHAMPICPDWNIWRGRCDYSCLSGGRIQGQSDRRQVVWGLQCSHPGRYYAHRREPGKDKAFWWPVLGRTDVFRVDMGQLGIQLTPPRCLPQFIIVVWGLFWCIWILRVGESIYLLVIRNIQFWLSPLSLQGPCWQRPELQCDHWKCDCRDFRICGLTIGEMAILGRWHWATGRGLSAD